jgi:hypothetical protein
LHLLKKSYFYFLLDEFWEGLHATYDEGLQLSIRLMTVAPVEFSLQNKTSLRNALSRDVLEDDGDHHLLLTCFKGFLSHDQRLALFDHMTRAMLNQQLPDEYHGEPYWAVTALGRDSVLQGLKRKNIWKTLLSEDLMYTGIFPKSPFFVNVMFFLTVAYIFYRDDPELGPSLQLVPIHLTGPFGPDMISTVFCNRVEYGDETVFNVHDIDMSFACVRNLKIEHFLARKCVIWVTVCELLHADRKYGLLTARIHSLFKELLFRGDSQPLHVEFLSFFLNDSIDEVEQEQLSFARSLYLSTYVLPVTLCALQITGSSEADTAARSP